MHVGGDLPAGAARGRLPGGVELAGCQEHPGRDRLHRRCDRSLAAGQLLLTTPRPLVFFGWIIALGTLVAVPYPFGTTAPLSQKFATATVNLFIGIAIGSLLTAVGKRSVGSG